MKEFAKRFYNSKKWKDCRKAYISQRILTDGGMCEKCHKMFGEELHHKKMLTIDNISNVDVSLNYDNLIWLCKDCHFAEHKEMIFKSFEHAKKKTILTKTGMWFDENGNVQTQKVYIVYGAPSSGKTTYVKRKMCKGDMVVDLDYILCAIGLTDKSNQSDNLLDVAIGIRDYLYNRIISHSIDSKHVWVIACLPNKKQREELSNQFNAELIHIDTPKEECIARANADANSTNKLKAEYIITKYFENWSE